MELKKIKNTTQNNKIEKSTRLKEMHNFAELYAKKTNTFFCLDPSITSVIIAGLADYKNKYKLPLCPCRNFRSERVEIELNFWICPCVAMRERKECHCKLFVRPEDSEASQTQKISLSTVYNNLIYNLYT
uniref:Ferredoxin-thioredoxin reductase, catalytic chain n=1 Tax=Pleurocladia lacustris TaxID=246121 RepID=A0A1I9LVX2_9PHAE|nr:ferredoxin-thioredoxin reductase beta subunit [Pleurocladia lacustris]ANS57598.1 ferredoxin-thioredoxin reductase beta subunit [Pleurocladia lacustris]ANS57742.1 ferredoxin-thioredoxin reductase beta subunit [Pleurocladia lacustris]